MSLSLSRGPLNFEKEMGLHMKIKPFPFCIKAFSVLIAILFLVETVTAQYQITFLRESHNKALLEIDRKTYRLHQWKAMSHVDT
jgi:hypothetical protein